VLDVADLNGDRIMELVTRSWTSEVLRVDLYALDGRRLQRVSRNDCDR
jgi:hypothetical protein